MSGVGRRASNPKVPGLLSNVNLTRSHGLLVGTKCLIVRIPLAPPTSLTFVAFSRDERKKPARGGDVRSPPAPKRAGAMDTVDTAYQQQAIDVQQPHAPRGLAPWNCQLLAEDQILGLKPRSSREPRPDSKQQQSHKRDHRPLRYHTSSCTSSRKRFSGGTGDCGVRTRSGLCAYSF
jgi:hypothetical protein